VTSAYDELGRVTSRTDANGNITKYGYDSLGRLTTVTDALSQVTSYTYDEAGNRLTQTDASTHTTSYAVLMIIKGYFDHIFTEDCDLSNPKIDASTLVICVRNIGVIVGHPLHDNGKSRGVQYFNSGHLIFEGVVASTREISEYEINPTVNKFKPKRLIQDGPFPALTGSTEAFRFMGILDSPRAWTDWSVVAISFSLEIADVA